MLTEEEPRVHASLLTVRTLVALLACTPREREVVVDHILRGLTQQETADLHHCTKQQVSQLKRSALPKMAVALAELDRRIKEAELAAA